MKVFIDTANLSEIKEAASWGIIDGVTTNPSLVAKESSQKFETIIEKICKIVDGPVSAEVVSLESTNIIKEAKKLAKIAPNVVIKIPMTTDGLKAVKALNKENIKSNLTLIFSANQALLAAKVGATFVSPFLGRLDDIGHTGVNLINEILQIYENYNFKTQIIAASLRHPNHVRQVALAGCHIATVPFAVLKKMYIHPKTDEGIVKFLEDWKKAT